MDETFSVKIESSAYPWPHFVDMSDRSAAGTKHRSQVIVLLTQKVSQTPLKANLRPNKFLFRPN